MKNQKTPRKTAYSVKELAELFASDTPDWTQHEFSLATGVHREVVARALAAASWLEPYKREGGAAYYRFCDLWKAVRRHQRLPEDPA